MDTQVLSNVVQETTDYDKFSFLNTNRDTNRGHIESIKKSFDEHGNLTKVQPVLVNERFQVIDGQHRFQACKEMEVPIFYTVVSDIGIHQARSMNLLHRQWRTPDFAKSYAEEGRRAYVNYLVLIDDYPTLSHSVLLAYSLGDSRKGLFAEFRNGTYIFEDVHGARERLDKLSELVEIVPSFRSKALAIALLKAMDNEGYDHERMVKKVTQMAPEIRAYQNVDDNLRQLENVYNSDRHGENRLRFF